MAAVLTVLPIILKILIAVLLVFLLAVLVVLFLLPLWLRWEETHAFARLTVGLGPWKWVPFEEDKTEEQEDAQEQPEQTVHRQGEKTENAPVIRQKIQTSPEQTAEERISALADKREKIRQNLADPPPGKEAERQTSALGKRRRKKKKLSLRQKLRIRLRRALHYAQDNPLPFAKKMLGYFGWMGNRFLQGAEVKELVLVYPITGRDAAETALLYTGAIHTANEILLLCRKKIKIKAEKLWMIPDFTGKQRDEWHVKGKLETRVFTFLSIIGILAWKLWHDADFRPEQTEQ